MTDHRGGHHLQPGPPGVPERLRVGQGDRAGPAGRRGGLLADDELPGTPDPDVIVPPNVFGDKVALEFVQAESSRLRRITELSVMRTRSGRGPTSHLDGLAHPGPAGRSAAWLAVVGNGGMGKSEVLEA